MSAEILADDLWICFDCVQLSSNGEVGDSAEYAEAHNERMQAALEELIGPGTAAVVTAPCRHAADGEDSCGCDEIPFSTRPCPTCGDPLAGHRFRAVVIR